MPASNCNLHSIIQQVTSLVGKKLPEISVREIFNRAMIDVYTSIPDKSFQYGIALTGKFVTDSDDKLYYINLHNPVKNIDTVYSTDKSIDHFGLMSRYISYCYNNKFLINTRNSTSLNIFAENISGISDTSAYSDFIIPDSVINNVQTIVFDGKLIHPGTIDEVFYKADSNNGMTASTGVWAKHGGLIYVYRTKNDLDTEKNVHIFAIRNLIFDNMLEATNQYSSLHYNIDLPDTLIPLAIRTAHKLCLEAITNNLGNDNVDNSRENQNQTTGV